MKKLDQFLNGITMYRLVLNLLLGLAVVGTVMQLVTNGVGAGLATVGAFFIFTIVCRIANVLFAKVFRAAANAESSLITALILFCIFSAPGAGAAVVDWLMLGVIAVVAIASKYILAFRQRHIFNPAAFAAVVFGFTNYAATWWIGSVVMLPFVAVAGFLIVRKIRRTAMVVATFVPAALIVLVLGLMRGLPLLEVMSQFVLSGPVVFFATVMVTEPFTTPPGKKLQLVYGFLVGVLYSLPFSFGPLFSTPEVALVAGNIFSYAVSLRRRLTLKLVQQREIAADTFEFDFEVGQPLKFAAGQFLEWRLPHDKTDQRGDRRYFTIASAPTEKNIKLGVKFADPSSSFKKALRALEPGDKIFAGSLGGDFVLPKDKNQKLVFMAGGIGVTPFRSMIQYLMDTGEQRDVILFCSNRTEGDIPYRDLLQEAEKKMGLRLICITGRFIDATVVTKNVSDYKNRMFYLSGPNAMVDAYKAMLKKIGVSSAMIMTDYFPGFV